MTQSFSDVQRRDMFEDGSVDSVAAQPATPHMAAAEGERVDALLAEADAGQEQLANLLGKATVADTVVRKPRTTFNWGTVSLASDGYEMPCYDHSRGIWL